MRYICKDLPGSVKRLEVDFSQVEFSKYWETVYGEMVKEVEIKGFRKGAAPKEMADAAIDKDKVFNEAATRAMREILKEIAGEKGWEIVDQPKIGAEEKGADLLFRIDLVVFPEIKLGNYKKIAKEVFSEKKEISVSDDEIRDAVNWILNSRAKIVRSANSAKVGDVVNIKYKGKDDQFILGHSHIKDDSGASAPSGAGSESAEWIDKKIVGRKEGEEFDGIKLCAVFERQLPELDDALAQNLGRFKTVDDLKKSIKEGIQKEKELKESEKARIKVLEEIIKETKIDIPQVMIEKTLAGMIEEYKTYFYSKGGSASGGNENEIKEKLRPEAEKSVASNLVLYKIAKEEKLEPNSEEVEAESNKVLAALRPDMAGKIDPQKIYNYSYDLVKNKKVFDFLEELK